MSVPGVLRDEHGVRRFFGAYRGKVFDNNDPKKMGRVRCLVPEVLGDVPTDWASLVSPYGGTSDMGFLFVPEKDAGVAVIFEAGDPDRPLVLGCWFAQPAGVSEVPTVAQGTGDTLTADPYLAQTVPQISDFAPPYAATYPNNKVIKTKSGHTIEIDDTPGEERIRIGHKTGSQLEFLPDGNVRLRCFGDMEWVIDGEWKVYMGQGWKMRVPMMYLKVVGDAQIDAGRMLERAYSHQTFAPDIQHHKRDGFAS